MKKPFRLAIKLELNWPFKRHSAIFSGVQQYAQEKDWHCIVDEFAEDRLGPTEKTLPYDGIIARATPLLVRRAKQRNIPLVNVWASSPCWQRVPSVLADFSAIGRLRAEHLLSRGIRHFAALSAENDRGDELDLKAFIATLSAAGCSCLVAKASLNAESSRLEWSKLEHTINTWMNHWRFPIGVYFGIESHGRIVTQICRNRGWRVPQDVAIMAGLNETILCEGLRPTLTSIEVGYERIGYAAARLLDQLSKGKAAPREPVLIPPLGLVVRESTDFMTAADEIIDNALKYIAANFQHDIGPADVARAVVTELRTLQRRFQKYLKRSIVAEICRVRIERAKRELMQSNRSLTEIALASGFADPFRMYIVFRRELGLTPSQYRRQQHHQG